MLEKVFEIDILLSINYLETICNNIHLLNNDSAIRSISRFLMLLCRKKIQFLTLDQVSVIIETNFDWLIGTYRVAVKHHAIYTLYELGKKQPWVHNELKLILIQDASQHSIVYQVLAKKILQLIQV